VLAQLLERPETTEPLPDDVLPKNVDSFYLTIYINGHLRGCMGQKLRNLDEDLKTIAKAALRDERFAGRTPIDADNVAVTVSFLFDKLPLGECPPEEVVSYYRHGDQTVMVYQEDRIGLLLPFVGSFWNLDPVGFARAVIEKAGLSEPPYYWVRFDCATWFAGPESVSPTAGGFVIPRKNSLPIEGLVTYHSKLHLHYLLKHLKEDGTFYSGYQPFHNRLYESPDLARHAHGAWVLARAANVFGGDELKSAVDKVVNSLLAKVVRDGDDVWLRVESETSTVAETSFLLLALSNLPENDPRRELMRDLAATLWRCVELPHGRIITHHNSDDPSPDGFQDYFPGQVLLALAVACEAKVSEIDQERLRRSFQYYRHRFLYKRHFGQASWLTQAFAKWWQVTADMDFAKFVFEMADWLLGYQQDKTGGFINDHQPGAPGYTTAVYLEGIAAALQVTSSLGDKSRYQTYSDSLARGFAFLDRLIIQERDRAILPNLDFALGGLRQGIHYSEIRTDFVQHSLSAILSVRPHVSGAN
jgi:AMMECR1 domain-containing protein